MDIPAATVRVCKTHVPISFAIVAKKPLVVLSDSLISLLKRDELEAVMAHELAHIRNSDTALKAFVTAYKATLPHDPVIRLVEAAFHREREILADDTAVAFTRKPLSLASALLKIYEAFPKDNLASYGSYSILGPHSPLMQHHPAIIPRVNRLVQKAHTKKFTR
jgi:Zn-dependent protease with chaperone function